MTELQIQPPEVVSREQWLSARKELLKQEKELTRARDRLNAARRRLPMVRVDKPYTFEGPGGSYTLRDLFEGRRQLVVYHFMFGPDWEMPCRSCSAGMDEIARGHRNHLRARTTTFAVVSRAPIAKIRPFKERMGWDFPWYSSYGTSFNYDFHVTLDESVTPIMYNYRTLQEHKEAGTDYYVNGTQPIELPGMSCFFRDGDEVFHTYSTYARGLETGGSESLLDLTVLGRQEEWEEPKGRVTGLGAQAGNPTIPYPDEYNFETAEQ